MLVAEDEHTCKSAKSWVCLQPAEARCDVHGTKNTHTHTSLVLPRNDCEDLTQHDPVHMAASNGRVRAGSGASLKTVPVYMRSSVPPTANLANMFSMTASQTPTELVGRLDACELCAR